MDKFFLALIGVFLGIFAYLKIQLSFSKKKAQKALSESAKINAEKESIENYASVMDALSKRLESLNKNKQELESLNSNTQKLESNNQKLESLNIKKDSDSNISLNNESSAETPLPSNTPLDSGASAFNVNKEDAFSAIEDAFNEIKENTNENLLDTDIQSLSHEQLIRLRQLKGL